MAALDHPIHDILARAVGPRPDGVVIDIGCGIGGTLAALLRHSPEAQLTGLDASATALDTARTQLPDTVDLVLSDVNKKLPLPDGSVDAVVCHNVIELLSEPGTFLVDVHRVLRVAGIAVIAHTDFASIVAHPTTPGLHQRIITAYTEHQQSWMASHDGYVARKLPGLINSSPLGLVHVDAHVDVTTDTDSVVAGRIDEIAAALAGHPDASQTDVDTWRGGLKSASRSGEFLFTETTYLARATKTVP